MPGSSLAHPVHNEKDLEPYHEPPLHRREGRPVAEIIKGQEEWEVEEILKKRKRGHGWQYLIKWKGYPNSENTWEAASRLTHAKRLLKEFNRRNPQTSSSKHMATRHIASTQGVPVLKQGHWDYLVKRFKPKHESLPYPSRKLFNYQTGRFVEASNKADKWTSTPAVDEDVDLEGGVMSESGLLTI